MDEQKPIILELQTEKDIDLNHEARIHPEKYYARNNPAIEKKYDVGFYLPDAEIQRYSIDYFNLDNMFFTGQIYALFSREKYSGYPFIAKQWTYQEQHNGNSAESAIGGLCNYDDEITNFGIKMFLEKRIEKILQEECKNAKIFQPEGQSHNYKQRLKETIEKTKAFIKLNYVEEAEKEAHLALQGYSRINYNSETDLEIHHIFEKLYKHSLDKNTFRKCEQLPIDIGIATLKHHQSIQ